jgi:hypothetical protein
MKSRLRIEPSTMSEESIVAAALGHASQRDEEREARDHQCG